MSAETCRVLVYLQHDSRMVSLWWLGLWCIILNFFETTSFYNLIFNSKILFLLYSCKFAHLKFFSKIVLLIFKNSNNEIIIIEMMKYLKKVIFIIFLLTSLRYMIYKSYPHKFKIFKHISQKQLQNNFQQVVKHLFQTFLLPLKINKFTIRVFITFDYIKFRK